MCDVACDAESSDSTNIRKTTLKERATKRRERITKELSELDAFLTYLEAHPELEEFAACISRY
jgi:hypothetical protein